MLGVPIGGALSYFFSGPIAHAYGWRVAMIAAAAPALLLIPALMLLHEPERGASETHREPVHTGSMWVVLKIPTLWWIIASGALVNFNMYAIGTFMPAMFGRIYHLNVGAAGIQTGIRVPDRRNRGRLDRRMGRATTLSIPTRTAACGCARPSLSSARRSLTTRASPRSFPSR